MIARFLIAALIATLFVWTMPAHEALAAGPLPAYYLPWDAGVSHYVSQGNNQGTHTGNDTYAWDFTGDGWTVKAARNGIVSLLKDDSNTGGCGPNFAGYANYVKVATTDGYEALYLHLAYGSVSSRVYPGESVDQYTAVGVTDSTGWVCPYPGGAHLHYQVQNQCTGFDCQSVSSSFLDPNVLGQDSNGIPQTGQTVVSGNGVCMAVAYTTGVAGTTGAYAYLNWFDQASPGFTADTVHLFNPSGVQTVTLALPGATPYTTGVVGGEELYHGFPGSIGGPVSISPTNYPMIASRRTLYYQSFSETNALSRASTDQYFNWFDKSTGGMCTDTIHITNPSTGNANITVTQPGVTPIYGTIQGGHVGIYSWPEGTLNGPVEVTSDVAVMASERVQYIQSFSELNAVPVSSASQTVWFSWYDNASPGMTTDNIHVTNPRTDTNSCYVTISINGGPSIPSFWLSAGQDQYKSFPPGTVGGAVKVDVGSSCHGILASQRVFFNGSFSEVNAMPGGLASSTLTFNWYDLASPGFYNDDIHVINPGAGTAHVTVTLPGAGVKYLTVNAGADQYTTFSGNLGGPVTISADQVVLGSQRVRYYSSFHESIHFGFRKVQPFFRDTPRRQISPSPARRHYLVGHTNSS